MHTHTRTFLLKKMCDIYSLKPQLKNCLPNPPPSLKHTHTHAHTHTHTRTHAHTHAHTQFLFFTDRSSPPGAPFSAQTPAHMWGCSTIRINEKINFILGHLHLSPLVIPPSQFRTKPNLNKLQQKRFYVRS